MHQDFLGRLGDRLGLPLRFDGNRQCLLQLDDQLLVALHANGHGWTLHGLLMKAPRDCDARFWRELMEMNLELATQRAGTLAYDPSSQALIYLDSIDEPGDTAAAFARLESFINRQEKLRALIRNHNFSWRPS
ncbi:chaperone SicP [Chromobacterium amazonense]|uniref:chaperone SicP n=1 Tax=Chromobacterium amazonense TaxID=1382803 RepID=UPI003F7ADD79